MRARTWAVAVLASAAALAFGAFGGGASGQANGGRPAALVNGQPISFADVEAAVKALNGASAVPTPEVRQRETRREALAMLMDNLLLQQFLRKNAAPVDAKEIARHIADLETALAKDNKKLADYLAENGMTNGQLHDQITTALQWRDYSKDRVTDAELLQYYKYNKDFFDGVQARASHILIRVPLKGSEGDVQAARARLQAIRQDIEAGKMTFADAAKKYSQCPSAPEGGDVGYFPRKFVWDEEFAKAAFDPQLKVGDLIGLVRTEQGWHLIKLTDRKAGTPSDYNKIKNDVRELYLTELRMRIVADQRKQARIEVFLP